jgi:multiple sugar transport system substrate-binding protein
MTITTPRRQFLQAGSLWVASCLLPACSKRRHAFPPPEGATSAERAVRAARRFAGTTLNAGWESGAQAEDPLRFSGPLWEKLTGIKINVLEMGIPIGLFNRLMAESKAHTGLIDLAMVAPAWMPSLLDAEALEPLDDYVNHYMMPGDLDDFLPVFRNLGIWNGKRYGLFDDGDTLLLYYRRDLFEDSKNRQDFATRYGRPLGNPRTYDWKQFVDAAAFFTDKFAPTLYGFAPFTQNLRWPWFQCLLRVNGGQFFDPATMTPAVDREPAVRTMADLAHMNRFIPPGTADLAEPSALFAAYLSGKAAMATFWPPLGRWAESYGGTRIGGVPKSLVAGKTGYALLPGGHTELALGWLLAIPSDSRQKEAAYLFMQWLNSPDVSLQRTMLPNSLRDPFRRSHIRSTQYRSLWPEAPHYLDTLQTATTKEFLDLAIPGAPEYEEAFYQAANDVRLGTAPLAAMQRMAENWDAITEHYGRERQRAAYREFLQHQAMTFKLPADEV